jgi:glycosyltransferase involved in cell wall biosynthesis
VIDVTRLLGPPAPEARRAEQQVDVIRRRLRDLGLAGRPLADLRELAADASQPYRQRLAAWELALWHADQCRGDDARQALEYLSVAAAGEYHPGRLRHLAVLMAECHDLTGDPGAAREAIVLASELGPDGNLCLAAANLEPDPARRVEWFNRALELHGLARIDFRQRATGDAFDGLTAGKAAAVPPSVDGPLVTVIMPAHNAAGTIGTALDSILSQRWSHLEVLVVDDASSDATAAVAAGYADRDPRVRLIRATTNGGTYVARNLALREAAGDFVTCHDADDWSHPEKIERQVRHLLAEPSAVANTTPQARATPDLRFHRRGKPGFYVFPNLSSLMFRRGEVVAALGHWDSVRFGADAELQRRIRRVFGDGAVVDLHPGPLCLQRQSADSLTGHRSFGYRGYFMGARRDYLESYVHHHRTAGSLWYAFPQPVRPFAVPAPMLPRRRTRWERRHLDVVIASDFRLVGGSTMSSLEEVEAHRRLGLRTGLMQMYHHDADPRREVAGKVRDVVDGDRVQMLVPGERIKCDLLIVRYPPVLQEWHRHLPDVTPSQVRVIVNQPPMSDYGPDAVVRYQIPRCHEHLQRYYDRRAVWHPIGPLVRRALHRHHPGELRLIELADEDWVNVIDVTGWRRPARPSPPGRPPRIGRHSRDHEMKWPASAEEITLVYPDSPDIEVHVLGGARTPQAVLGYLPRNWHVYEFGEVAPREFLAGLDVFVYYPNPHWVESFGRVVLEAMAVGVPVVLPGNFRPLFGEAAIYAAPADVGRTVDHLLRDEDHHQAQVDLAWRFVEERFGYTRHAERLRGLLRSGA